VTSAIRKIAFFDFDGTITQKDTLFELIKFVKGKAAMFFGLLLLSPWFGLFILKLLPNWKLKQKVLSYFFRGMSAEAFQNYCGEFSNEALPKLLKRDALSQIREFRTMGVQVVIVTASAENWVHPWCAANDIRVIGTRLEVVNSRLTGKLMGKNCYGSEKVARISKEFDLSMFDEIICYGDSKGDQAMLEIANSPNYKAFLK